VLSVVRGKADPFFQQVSHCGSTADSIPDCRTDSLRVSEQSRRERASPWTACETDIRETGTRAASRRQETEATTADNEQFAEAKSELQSLERELTMRLESMEELSLIDVSPYQIMRKRGLEPPRDVTPTRPST